MTLDNKERKLKSYHKRRAVEVAMQTAKVKTEFLQMYPDWEEIKVSIRTADREVIEAVHGLNGIIVPFQELAEQRKVSRQAVFAANKKALERLDRLTQLVKT